MKRIVIFFAAALLFAGLAKAAEAEMFEYAVIHWDGAENTHVIFPDGTVAFVGSMLNGAKKPDRVDDRAFYMTIMVNALARQGYEFAFLSNDQNTIFMKRPLGSPSQVPALPPSPPQAPTR